MTSLEHKQEVQSMRDAFSDYTAPTQPLTVAFINSNTVT